MLLREAVAGGFQLGDHALRRDASRLRRAARRIEAEIDDRQAPAGLEGAAQPADSRSGARVVHARILTIEVRFMVDVV